MPIQVMKTKSKSENISLRGWVTCKVCGVAINRSCNNLIERRVIPELHSPIGCCGTDIWNRLGRVLLGIKFWSHEAPKLASTLTERNWPKFWLWFTTTYYACEWIIRLYELYTQLFLAQKLKTHFDGLCSHSIYTLAAGDSEFKLV